MGTTGLVVGLMTPWDANSPPLNPKDWLFWEKAHGGLITAEKWMPLVQVGDWHGVTGLWERWVWAEAMPEAGGQRGRNHGGLVPTTTSPPLRAAGPGPGRLRGSTQVPSCPPALSRGVALARTEQHRWQRHHGLAREAAEIESRALGCCHFTAPSS